jgi:hypothetical protein
VAFLLHISPVFTQDFYVNDTVGFSETNLFVSSAFCRWFFLYTSLWVGLGTLSKLIFCLVVFYCTLFTVPRRRLLFLITHLPSWGEFRSYECFLMSLTSLRLFWTLFKLLLFRCKSQVRDVILCFKIPPSLGRFIYGCPMVNMSVTFLDSVTLDYAKFSLPVSLDRTIRAVLIFRAALIPRVLLYIYDTVQMLLNFIPAVCPAYPGSFWVLWQVVGFVIYGTSHFAIITREFH